MAVSLHQADRAGKASDAYGDLSPANDRPHGLEVLFKQAGPFGSVPQNKATLRQNPHHCEAREPLSYRAVHFSEQLTSEVEMTTARPTLNFDAPEPVVTTDPNASALFPTQPVYARTPKRKASNNLPLLIGVPVVAVVAGGLIWAMSANRAEAPTDPQSLKVAAA
ncbi:MAG TPA: hypothetical protein VN158_02190, partial [Caulobacter sp.]|nr:hypothetical protein [Caulobacter sp.]